MYGREYVTGKTRCLVKDKRLRRTFVWSLALFATTLVLACPESASEEEETPPPPSATNGPNALSETPVAYFLDVAGHDIGDGITLGFLYQGAGLACLYRLSIQFPDQPELFDIFQSLSHLPGHFTFIIVHPKDVKSDILVFTEGCVLYQCHAG